MSEEEAISELEGYILNHSNFHEDFKEAIDTILDLYKQEKEKNKETKIIADSFHEKMAKKFDEDFIPKSKIEEKIEELEKTKFGRCTDTIDILQELLEENRNDK